MEIDRQSLSCVEQTLGKNMVFDDAAKGAYKEGKRRVIGN